MPSGVRKREHDAHKHSASNKHSASKATIFRVPARRAHWARVASLGPPVRKVGGMMRLPLK